MMKIELTVIVAAWLAVAGLRADDTTTHHALTLDGARKAAEAAAAYARDHGANPSIAVVDEGGHLLY